MAKREQLARLLRSVEEWNQWREENPSVRVDLSRADLSRADLSGVNLSSTNLWNANLRNANLSNAYLRGARFRSANLWNANLRNANLSYAYFGGANLRNANLGGAELGGAELGGADLGGADLREAKLDEFNLKNASRGNADLRGVNLSSANLTGLNISEFNLSNADLSHADLSHADLSHADLREADLSNANLSTAQALYTNFESAVLTGVCIQDWNINSKTNLDGVICEFIYLKDGYPEYRDRRPSDLSKTFAEGDFARLFQQLHETADLIFRNGIDWQAFSTSFQALKAEQIKVEPDDRAFSVRAIESLDDGSFVVRINTPKGTNKAEIERSFQAKYEGELKQLEAGYRKELQAKDSQIEQHKRENTNLTDIVKAIASRPININNRNITVSDNDIQGSAYTEELKGSGYTEGDNTTNAGE
ncbi:MAG: pentapeptide repeat-containing protein [Cyanobacteria bacterium SBLK]|nr:pentapeptide repeat-containing protein [Cyanobacteria bacterium SBLK]